MLASFRRKKTLASFWGASRSGPPRDLAAAVLACYECCQQARDGVPRTLPCRPLSRGWPGEVVASGLFGHPLVTRGGESLIAVIVGDVSRRDHLTPPKRADAADAVAVFIDTYMYYAPPRASPKT